MVQKQDIYRHKKRNFASIFSFKKITFYGMLTLSLQSCAWLSGQGYLLDDEDKTASKTKMSKTVPREQYEDLLKKYEGLVKKGREISPDTLVEKKEEHDDPSQLVDELNRMQVKGGKPELAETVDVFGSKGIAPKISQAKSNIKIVPIVMVKGEEVEFEIQQLRKAENLLRQNRFDASIKILKKLEDSSSRQIRVRAKFDLGEILFAQKEYDLAMQVFEDIVKQNAFSGVIFKVLGRLIICSDKLRLTTKKDKYYSILHDFFGTT